VNFPTNFCCVSFCSFFETLLPISNSSLWMQLWNRCEKFQSLWRKHLIRLRRWIPTNNRFPNLSLVGDILVKGPPLARILVQFRIIKISFMYILTMSQDGTSPIWRITLKLTFMSSNWNHLHCLGIKSQLFEVKSSYIQRPKTDW